MNSDAFRGEMRFGTNSTRPGGADLWISACGWGGGLVELVFLEAKRSSNSSLVYGSGTVRSFTEWKYPGLFVLVRREHLVQYDV